MTQSTTYPSTLLPLEIINQRLREFVRLHHLDLLRTVNYQISKKFSKQLSRFSSFLSYMSFRHEMIDESLKIRQK